MALHRKGKNGSIFPILTDVPMKPQQPIQHLPCVLYSMPTIWSERINEEDGETVTKTQKRMPTTLTCRRPFQSEGFRLISLRRFSQKQPKNNGYIRHFNTVVMNVLTEGTVEY